MDWLKSIFGWLVIWICIDIYAITFCDKLASFGEWQFYVTVLGLTIGTMILGSRK